MFTAPRLAVVSLWLKKKKKVVELVSHMLWRPKG